MKFASELNTLYLFLISTSLKNFLSLAISFILFEDVSETAGKGFTGGDRRLYDRMIDKGILIRDCSDYEGLIPGYYRIAVKTHEENITLLNQLLSLE